MATITFSDQGEFSVRSFGFYYVRHGGLGRIGPAFRAREDAILHLVRVRLATLRPPERPSPPSPF